MESWQLASIIITSITALATCVLAGGIILAFKQVQQMRRSTNAQIAVNLFRIIRSEDSLEKLRFIYRFQHPLTHKEVQDLHYIDLGSSNIAIDKEAIDSLLDQFDVLGGLVKHQVVDDEIAIEVYAGAPVLRCWYQLKDYIMKERDIRGSYYCENLQGIAVRVLQYIKEHPSRRDWVLFRPGMGGEPINLFEVLSEDLDLR